MQIRRFPTPTNVSALLVLLLFTLQGCKLGYNKTPKRNTSELPAPECAPVPQNPNINDNANDTFKLLADLTCNALTKSNDGFLMGQSTGYGNQISTESHRNSYDALITGFAKETNKMPAMVAIDYEYDQEYTLQQLLEANEELSAHWSKGGFVTISWTPLNPWLTFVQSDTESTGTTVDTGAAQSHDDTQFTDDVVLADLLDDSTDISQHWQANLDRIGSALKDLMERDDSVTVLWRPLPEMNSNTYWWGLDASKNEAGDSDASLYKDLWEHMYRYLTDGQSLSLQNLLWVYSPGESGEDANTKVGWAYPGGDFVDIVAGIARNDELEIKDYEELKNFDKPLGMAEYGPNSSDGNFDNQLYADRLNGSYNFVSYWISGHDTDTNQRSLFNNDNLEELVKRGYIFNLEDKKRE